MLRCNPDDFLIPVCAIVYVLLNFPNLCARWRESPTDVMLSGRFLLNKDANNHSIYFCVVGLDPFLIFCFFRFYCLCDFSFCD